MENSWGGIDEKIIGGKLGKWEFGVRGYRYKYWYWNDIFYIDIGIIKNDNSKWEGIY